MPEPQIALIRGSGRKNHHDLAAWQAAIDLAAVMYTLTQSFPGAERNGLTGQVRRSVVSVAANLAEGASRLSTKEYLRFVGIARSSLMELETLLIIAERVGLTSRDELEAVLPAVNSTFALLSGLISSLRRRDRER
jgi:four helix bundle protein